MIIAADNLNALNPRVAKALQELDPKPIREITHACVHAKADLLDINPGYLSKNQEDRIIFLIETVQEVTSLGLILDSPHPKILAKGLAACREKPILNALTLEEKKLEEILPLAVEFQTPLVLLLLDQYSMPPATLEGKLALAIELRERAVSAGMAEEQLLFDPLLPHWSWPETLAQIKALIEMIRLLSSGALFNFPARTMVGLSNLRSGQNRKEPYPLEETCLNLLAGAGLSHVLANVLRPEVKTWLNRIQPLI
jgi:5-methyltetrahydrofolate corrinoid/iron sulfur protein methyltransferase